MSPPNSAPSLLDRVLGRPHATIITIVFLVVWGLITHGTYAGSGDEPHYLMIAHSLAFDGDLDLTNDYASHPALIGGGTLLPELHAVPGKDGRLRPVHDIGLPILATPVIFLAYPFAEWTGRVLPAHIMRRARLNPELVFRHSLSLMMALVTGLLAVQLFEILVREGVAFRAAMAWSLLVTLSPPLLSHSFLFFTEIPSALLVAWLFRELSMSTPRRWPLIGLAIGLLLLIHVRNISLVAVFSAWAVWRLWRERRSSEMLAFFLALALPVAIRSAATWTFWGTLFTSPIARPDFNLTTAQVISMTTENIVGMFTDFDLGLLSVAPIYLLALPGLVVLWRRRPAVAVPLLMLAGAYLATIAIPAINPYGYAGGFAPTARMLTPVVPLLAIPVCVGGDAARGFVRTVVVVLLLAQVGIDLVMWNSPKHLWSGARSTGPNLPVGS